jgi:RNA polymerase sigma-70 factor, ECF subfamily
VSDPETFVIVGWGLAGARTRRRTAHPRLARRWALSGVLIGSLAGVGKNHPSMDAYGAGMSLTTPGSTHGPVAAEPVAASSPAQGRRTMRAASKLDSGKARESQALLDGLHVGGSAREAAITELHGLLLRGAHHELRRRRDLLADISYAELDDLAMQAADDALAAILAKLHTFRGASRFTTWAYKFVLLEAGVKARRRAWQGREVALEDESWRRLADAGPSAQQRVEDAELLHAIVDAIDTCLTPHQREIFTALALNAVPIDVLAERLTCTRGALYKTLHDARRKLRATLADAGYEIDEHRHTGGEK